MLERYSIFIEMTRETGDQSPSSPDKAVKGNIFLHPSVWSEVETLAKANGIQPAEQLRACTLRGLRSFQREYFDATGVSLKDLS